MFPIIYANNETSFASNGLGALSDCIRCEVTEELNGIFEMELEVPITGNHYRDIKQRRIIYAMTPSGKQPFEVYRISKPINGVVTVYCQHLSYRLLKMTTSLFSSPTCAAAGAELATQASTAEGATWTFWTDKDIHSMYRVAYPKTIRNCFGGEQGSMIQLYGGELEFDHRTIKLHTHRGADNGVEIRYAKNMSDITDDDNAADVYKSVIPYYYQEGGNCIVGSKVTKSASLDAPFDLTIPLDCSSEFQSEPTAAQLTAYAQTYIDARTPTVSDETITVSFVPLAGSSGYEGLEELETVNIGDTVTVINSMLGVSTQKKANKYVYDALNERYISVELGAKKSTLGKTISDELGRELEGVNNQLAGKVSETEMTDAITAATDLITGGTGGYVFTGRNNDGEPNEIFIMDTNNTVTAVNVIRLNNNGIGFSHNGINGPFTNAWTIDGHFIADFIYSGTLQSKDANTNFSLTLNTGEMTMKNGSINLGYSSTGDYYKFTIDNNGVLTTRYTDGDTAWKLDGNELQVFSDSTTNQVGELSYRSWRPVGASSDVETFDARFEQGTAFTVSSGLGTRHSTVLSVESDKISSWADMYHYGNLQMKQIVVGSTSNVYQGDGLIGYEEHGNNDIKLVIRDNPSDTRIEITEREGDFHIYTNGNNEAQFEIHGAGGRGLYLGKNGLLYNNGNGQWHYLKMNNGSGGTSDTT